MAGRGKGAEPELKQRAVMPQAEDAEGTSLADESSRMDPDACSPDELERLRHVALGEVTVSVSLLLVFCLQPSETFSHLLLVSQSL